MLPTPAVITVDRWISTFKPQLVHSTPIDGISPSELAPWGGTMFETFGGDLDRVLAARTHTPLHVWTLMDDGQTVANGYHLVNRLGYFICETPFNEHEAILAVDDD